MGLVTASFSSKALTPSVEYTVICTTPEELVEAIHNRTEPYCQYNDERGKQLDLEEALEVLGVSPEDMQEFKKANGFFYRATPDEIAKWERQSWMVRGVLALCCLAIIVGIVWLVATR